MTAALLMKAERSSGDNLNLEFPRDWLRPPEYLPLERWPLPKERPRVCDWLFLPRPDEKLERPDEYLELLFLMLLVNNKRLCFEQSVNYILIAYFCKPPHQRLWCGVKSSCYRALLKLGFFIF
jgi:hypothetical protein